jgi:hypothetical protein
MKIRFFPFLLIACVLSSAAFVAGYRVGAGNLESVTAHLAEAVRNSAAADSSSANSGSTGGIPGSRPANRSGAGIGAAALEALLNHLRQEESDQLISDEFHATLSRASVPELITFIEGLWEMNIDQDGYLPPHHNLVICSAAVLLVSRNTQACIELLLRWPHNLAMDLHLLQGVFNKAMQLDPLGTIRLVAAAPAGDEEIACLVLSGVSKAIFDREWEVREDLDALLFRAVDSSGSEALRRTLDGYAHAFSMNRLASGRWTPVTIREWLVNRGLDQMQVSTSLMNLAIDLLRVNGMEEAARELRSLSRADGLTQSDLEFILNLARHNLQAFHAETLALPSAERSSLRARALAQLYIPESAEHFRIWFDQAQTAEERTWILRGYLESAEREVDWALLNRIAETSTDESIRQELAVFTLQSLENNRPGAQGRVDRRINAAYQNLNRQLEDALDAFVRQFPFLRIDFHIQFDHRNRWESPNYIPLDR